MIRIIFDNKGKAYEYKDDVLVWHREDLGAPEDRVRGPIVMGDLPSFVSPIDGSLVNGRAGLREHCARHNVVPTADLAGLPPKPMILPTPDSHREQTRRTMAEIINSRY